MTFNKPTTFTDSNNCITRAAHGDRSPQDQRTGKQLSQDRAGVITSTRYGTNTLPGNGAATMMPPQQIRCVRLRPGRNTLERTPLEQSPIFVNRVINTSSQFCPQCSNSTKMARKAGRSAICEYQMGHERTDVHAIAQKVATGLLLWSSEIGRRVNDCLTNSISRFIVVVFG